MKKKDLDKRICDCEAGASNQETYREFLINGWSWLSNGWVDLKDYDFDGLSEEELNCWIDELDWLLEK